MIIYEYNHCFWKLAASKSLQSHVAKSVTVRFCGSGPSAKDLEGCPWDALHSGLALGFSWLWCFCTTAEGASAIPKENRASGCCRKQIPTCSSLYSITAGRLEAFVKVEETEWGVLLFVIWWRFWSYEVWEKKMLYHKESLKTGATDRER